MEWCHFNLDMMRGKNPSFVAAATGRHFPIKMAGLDKITDVSNWVSRGRGYSRLLFCQVPSPFRSFANPKATPYRARPLQPPVRFGRAFFSKPHNHEYANSGTNIGKNLQATVLGKKVEFRVDRDCKDPKNGRVFIQCQYEAPCTVSGEIKTCGGRKWYLSDYMTDDEVVKTAYSAFETCVRHEVMEGFLFNGQRVFNPHTPFQSLLLASQENQYRPQQ